MEKTSELVSYRPSAMEEAEITKTSDVYCIAWRSDISKRVAIWCTVLTFADETTLSYVADYGGICNTKNGICNV